MASSSSTDPSSANHVFNMAVDGKVSHKLSGDKKSNNYLSWQKQMRHLIESHGLLHYIDDSTCCVEFETDQKIIGWIFCAVAESVRQAVANFTTAREVWSELERFFTSSSGTPPPNTNEDEWSENLPLYRATLSGDWEEAIRIIESDTNAIEACRIGYTRETILHTAVGTGKGIPFVQNLVDMMPNHLIEVQSTIGYNPLHVAALTGNTEAARILIRRRHNLLYVPDNNGSFPVHLAALYAHRETLRYLISRRNDDICPSPYLGQTGLELLCTVIESNIFDVALDLATEYPHLATLIRGNGGSALQGIALQDSAFASGERSLNFLERLIYSVPRAKENRRRKEIHEQALRLVICLCTNMGLFLDFRTAAGIYEYAMLTAARLGVHEVIEEVVRTLPTAVFSMDDEFGQYIFHVAVENRSEKVFNLVYQASNLKHLYLDNIDTSGNTLLHLAGKLAPSHKLNLISGPALQMQRELQWFQEVEKFVNSYNRKRSNKAGKTPEMVFTEEHMELKANGEKWMRDTANSCTIVAALIATVVFAAAITVPGGSRSDSGFPLLYTRPAFILFAVSDAISLFTSLTSLLMFLSILTSRYAEQDFLYALPKRLCIGLVTLFMSILFMIVAFSATLYLVFGKAEKNWILIPVVTMASLPVITFVLLQSPLLVDVISNTYGRGIFGKQSDRPFY